MSNRGVDKKTINTKIGFLDKTVIESYCLKQILQVKVLNLIVLSYL